MAEVEILQCRHGVMAHFAADRAVGLSLREYGEWGEDEIALLAPHIGTGATVLDVGANVGMPINLGYLIAYGHNVYRGV